MSELECNRLINQVILADYVEPNKLVSAQTQMSSLTNQVIVINPDLASADKLSSQSVPFVASDKPAVSKAISQVEQVAEILPISTKQKTNLMVLGSSVDELGKQKHLANIVLLDSDADGLPDDQEKRFGTDPNKADSDGDGYSDLVEIKSGYDPLGPGKKEHKLTKIDKAIVDQAVIEQPKEEAPVIDQTLKIAEVNNTNSQAGSYQINGKALPNQIVTLYIYSQLPLVLTMQADANGNWVYQLDKSLNDGKHEVYVAINDDAGRIVSQATPLSFFVKEAKAVSMDQYIAEDQSPLSAPDPAGKMMAFYIAGGSALILAVFLIFIMFRKFLYQ